MNRSEKNPEQLAGMRWPMRRIGTSGFLIVMLALGSRTPGIALAADSGVVSGVVRDGQGKGLAGASVTLISHSGAASISHATSGPTGEYRFSGLSDGEYSVSAEMAGYAAAGERTAQLTADSNTATVDLVLIRTSAKPAIARSAGMTEELMWLAN